MKKLVTATWDILKAAEWVEKHYPDSVVPKRYLPMLYKGTAITKIINNRISDIQRWGVTIVTVAKAENQEEHTHTLNFTAKEPIDFNGFVRQVAQLWIETVDKDLENMDCISAVATARALV